MGCGSLHIHKHIHTQNREWTWLLLLPTTILLFLVTVPWISEAVCLSCTQSIRVRTYDPGLVKQSNFIPLPCDWHMSHAVLIRYKLHSSISASSAKRWYFDFLTVFVSFLKSFRKQQVIYWLPWISTFLCSFLTPAKISFSFPASFVNSSSSLG